VKRQVKSPEGAVRLTSYTQLDEFVTAFAEGHLNLLIVVGSAGTAKSHSVRQAVGEKGCWIEGNATAFGLYSKLYQNQNKLVVIDDVDSLYSDRAAVRLLKCLCQTEERKTIQWNSAAAGSMPTEFQTTSRVVIIANEWKTLNENVTAVQDRGHFVFFDPNAQAVHEQVRTWFQDEEILGWFESYLHLMGQPSMRQYVRAAELKSAGLDWQTMIASGFLPPKAVLVAKLKSDPRFQSEGDRVEEFRRLGAGSRATYFNQAKKLRRAA